MKNITYALFFVLLNALYLIVELSFNAYLLDASSAMSLQTDFSNLELYGRSISAAGATILFWRLLVPFKKQLNVSKTLIKFLLITIIVFPSVFMAQKKLIDYLVDSSTAEMRRAAEILSVLKYGISHGFVEIDGLSIDEYILKTAEGKMFVTLAGLLIYSSEEELQKIDSKLDLIAGYAATTQKIKDTQVNYRNYQYATEKIVDLYQDYVTIASQYERQRLTTRQKSIEIYQQAIRFGLNRWSSYVIKKINIEREFKSKSTALRQLITQLHGDVSLCQVTQCLDEQSQVVIDQINRLLGTQSDWYHWCEIIDQSKGTVCESSVHLIDYKLSQIIKTYLISQFGFDRFYTNKMDYLLSHEFYELFLQSLEQHEVPLNSRLPLTQHEQIIDEINDHLSRFFRQQYENEVSELMGIIIRPRLTIDQFTQLPSMQRIYQKALGDMYIKALPISLSRDEFLEEVVQPISMQQQEILSNKLSSDSSWFNESSPYEESGKNSIRNLVIPPVAIAISLIFGALNFISLVLNIIFLMVKESAYKRWIGFVILVFAFTLVPKFNQYPLSDQTAYEQLINYTQEEYMAAVLVGQWVIKIEPIVYYFGNILRVNVLDDFEFN